MPQSALDRPIAQSRRLPLREPPYDDDMRRNIENTAFKGLSPLNLRLALAHHPVLGSAFQALAHAVLFKGALPERIREIAIIRTGALNRSEYVWGMHVSIYGTRCGLDGRAVDDLTLAASWRDLADERWTGPERLAVRMADELHAHSTVGDETWEQLSATWPREQVMELIFSAIVYRMNSTFLNAAAVPLEEGQARFPASLPTAPAIPG